MKADTVFSVLQVPPKIIVENSSSFEWSDLSGVIVGCVAVVATVLATRQQNYSGVVTASRMDWIRELRGALTAYLVAHHAIDRDSSSAKLARSIYIAGDGNSDYDALKQAEVRVWMLLNPEPDARAEAKLEHALRNGRHLLLDDSTDADALEKAREAARKLGQELIKRTWEEVKEEAGRYFPSEVE